MKKGRIPITFKLMIVAVIAVAILGILMGFLSGDIKFELPEPEPQPQFVTSTSDVLLDINNRIKETGSFGSCDASLKNCFICKNISFEELINATR